MWCGRGGYCGLGREGADVGLFDQVFSRRLQFSDVPMCVDGRVFVST